MKFKTLCLAIIMSCSLVTQSLAFSDVLGTEWYASYVQTLNNRNIINGYEDDTFRAENSITYGEVLKIVITSLGEEPFENTRYTHWATGYLDKCISLGIPLDATMDLDLNASRYFVCTMMLTVLGIDTINIVSPFIDIDDDIINTLYELGVVTGEIIDGQRYFNAESDVKRSEVTALIVRTMDLYDKKIKKKTYEHIDIEYIEYPSTVEDFKNVILYNAINNVEERYILYPEINFYEMRDTYQYHTLAGQAFYQIFDEYPEYFTFANQISTPVTGTSENSDLTIKLNSSYFEADEIIKIKEAFFEEVEDIWHVLHVNGSIFEQMTQRQKAEVIFEWIVTNNEYDLTYQTVSYTGYGMTENNTGVCQGYVALFNALCKMEGIEVHGISGTVDGVEHIWSYANLDNEWCYIDLTFADPVPNKIGFCDFSYFDISETQLRLTHDF